MYSYPQDEAVGPQQAAEASHQLEPAGSSTGDSGPDAHGGSPGAGRRPPHVSALLAEIARAMQAAAAQERERIHAGLGDEESSQIEKVRARATAEAAALRKGADADVQAVQAWCEEEINRIRLEAERRITERRDELDQSITQHGSLIETEIQSVHGAVGGYRGTLDAFFARLAEEGDPSAIAGLAGTLPDPPDLDAVRADARSQAMKALEEAASAPEVEAPDDGSAGEGATVAGPTADGATGETQVDAATQVPPSVEELVPVMEAEADTAPVPVMDPDAETSTHENVAFRVLHSLTNRATPAASADDTDAGAPS